MEHHSDYLDRPLRSLSELRDEIACEVAEVEAQQITTARQMLEADSPEAYDDLEAAASRHERELHRLMDRLDEVEEELAWAHRDDPGRPITL